jgi:hypothetical protein
MATTARPKTTRQKTDIQASVSADAIAHRAFELFSARGGEHGRDLDDWLRAERELTSTATPPKRRIIRKSSPTD